MDIFTMLASMAVQLVVGRQFDYKVQIFGGAFNELYIQQLLEVAQTTCDRYFTQAPFHILSKVSIIFI
jgi:hypothetical protein